MSHQVENMTESEFVKNFNNKINTISIGKKNINKEYVNNYNFLVKNSSDIKYELLKTAEELIDRVKGKKDLEDIISLEYLADRIERGIFEFALLTVTLQKLQDHFVLPVYQNKLYNLCVNLDMENKRIENHTLLPNILSGSIDPYFLSFLSPEQLHPKRWMDIVNKIQLKNKTKYEMQTTDIYKCKKCGQRKSMISELQTRSLDEPVTRYVTCMVCYHTFKFS
jgi:DNA-directed RNA polymerase subunit M/transcription elongation factor TFIIS